MIGYLKGFVIDTTDDSLVLEVAGVGYELQVSSSVLNLATAAEVAEPSTSHSSQLPSEIQVWVFTHVREDAITLFGFANLAEKRMFTSLLKVNGVGPKMAMKIISAAPLETLRLMIDSGDVKSLATLPKVGKKTAEQLILALKGKLVLSEDSTAVTRSREAPRFSGSRAEVLSALVNLGFRLQDSEKVVADLPDPIEVQVGIRQALQVLSGSF